MKIIISGGGTGGHLYPALSILDELKKQNKDIEIIFIGTRSGIEAKVLKDFDYKVEYIPVTYIKRSFSFHNIKSLFMLIFSILKCMKIIFKFKPDIVIGTGGYVTGPVLFSGWLLRKKTLIHEQNVYPGITTKLLSKLVNRVCIGFDECRKYLKRKDNIVLTGNPIREEFKTIDSKKINKTKKILIYGGSGGSEKINEVTIEYINNYFNNDYEINFLTGRKFYDDTVEKINNKNVNVIDYSNDIVDLINDSSFVITSAGAITIAELIELKKPSILIPKAYTAENHQFKNAKAMEEKGVAILLEEKDLSPKLLHENIEKVINDSELLDTFSENFRAFDKNNSEEKIIKEIKTLLT